ncbi:MAG: protein-disulfide isomerase, partial [Acidimicrobiales bacterium]
RQGVDAAFVLNEIADGWPIEQFRAEHEAAEKEHSVFGVPTFVAGDKAVFVRVMTRPDGDARLARRTIEGILRLMVGFPELNELKHTSIPR